MKLEELLEKISLSKEVSYEMKSLSAFILETSKDVMPAIERICFIIVNKKQETKLTFLRRLILWLLDILISEQNSFKSRSRLNWFSWLPNWSPCFKKTDSRSYVRKLQFRVINTTFFRNYSKTSVITDIWPWISFSCIDCIWIFLP